MNSSKDYYRILGINRDASPDDVKKAYRKIAKECHPDINPGNSEAESRFKEASEAYEILSNTQKKSKYDNQGFSPFEFFSNDFGRSQGRRNRRSRKGNNINVSVQLTLEEIITGVKKRFKVYRKSKCPDCDGVGASKENINTCGSCLGLGFKKTTTHTPFGSVEMEEDCYSCGGTGKIIKNPCSRCSGSGSIRNEEVLEISIPRGSVSGVSFIVDGKGDYIKNGVPGDVIVTVEEYFHKEYKRDGINLISNRAINFKEACLGTELSFSNPRGGEYKIKIPPGTQPGKIFRLSGKGVPEFNGTINGDILIRVNVKVPDSISETQKDLLDQFYSDQS